MGYVNTLERPIAVGERAGAVRTIPVARHGLPGARRTAWELARTQLGGGLLLALGGPWLLRSALGLQPLPSTMLAASLLSAAAAIVGGYYVFRRVSRYPGVRASFHILPVFTVAYFSAFSFLFFAKLDHSRILLISSYFFCVAWYYLVYFKLQRQRTLNIGVIPCGTVDALYDIAGVNWVTLDEPTVAAHRFDAFVVDLRADISEKWERFLADQALEGSLILHQKQIQESLTGRVSIEHLSENNFGSLVPAVVYAKVKRAIDLVGSLLLLPMLAPALLVIALLIRWDSPGRAIYRQERIGYRGRAFTIYKFRSMADGHSRTTGDRSFSVTRDQDERVTRIGRFLRRYRLDELPQILNVIRGEMSLIGPRPEALQLSKWYEGELPFYRYRHIVRPGITGWAQVKQGHVAEVHEVQSKLHYDFYYIKNFSLWLDVLIVAGTFRVMLGGFGAR